MKNRTPMLKTLFATVLLTGSAATAHADRTDDIRFAAELDACVTALKDNLNLDGVHRIRHIVRKSDAQSIGYALTLKTSTYSDGAERLYSAYCVVVGNNKPTRLHIEEITG